MKHTKKLAYSLAGLGALGLAAACSTHKKQEANDKSVSNKQMEPAQYAEVEQFFTHAPEWAPSLEIQQDSDRAPASEASEADDSEETVVQGPSKSKKGKELSADLKKKFKTRSKIRSSRRKLYASNGAKSEKRKRDFTPVNKPRGNRLTANQKTDIKNRQASIAKGTLSGSDAVPLASQAPRTKSHTTQPGWVYEPYSLWFDSYDYVSDLNYRYYTYYAPAGATRTSVEFEWVDLESTYDYIEIYDEEGLCDTYTGYWEDSISNECRGDQLQIWVVTDGSRSGDTYDGFKIAGFWSNVYEETDYSPVAIARASSYSVSTGSTVYFDGSSSYDPDGYTSELTYFWDFGDGTTSTWRDPSKTFSRPGTYLVTLEVEDADGLYSFDEIYVSVFQRQPSAAFTLSASTVSTSNPAKLTLGYDHEATSLYIDWGDGTIVDIEDYGGSNRTFEHRYTRSGSFNIVVKAWNSAGVDVETRTITVSGQEIPPYLEIKNLGELNSKAGKTYSFAPCLVFGDDGSVKSLTANWGGAEPYNGVQTLPLTPRNCGYNGVKVVHDYKGLVNGKVVNLAGAYRVTFRAVDNTDTATEVKATLTTKNVGPTVKGAKVLCNKATRECTAQIFNKKKTFEQLVFDADGELADFHWEFLKADKVSAVEGCSSSMSASATCTFPSPGVYYVKAKATDQMGLYKEVLKKVSFKK